MDGRKRGGGLTLYAEDELINATCTYVLCMVIYQILQILLLLTIISCFTLSSDMSYSIDQMDTNKTERILNIIGTKKY